MWQAAFFSSVPEMMVEFTDNMPLPAKDDTPHQVEEGIERLKAAKPETGYDTAAIESYEIFEKMRQKGVVQQETKFQVCIPGMASVISAFVQRDFQAAVEAVYEEALLRAMRNIQQAIPHKDLSIQVDLAVETMFSEGLGIYPAWFFTESDELDKRKEYVIEYLLRLFSKVDQDVGLGIHNCYGDMGHRHWKEPDNLKVVTERALGLLERSSHPIQYFHVPVPVSAMDKLEAFYEPLKEILPQFKEHSTDLYLGVVQPELDGTNARIEAAQKVLGA